MGGAAEGPSRAGAGLWTRAFTLAWLGCFLHTLALHSYLHLPGFLEGLGASEYLIGVIFGMMSVSGLLARPAVGRAMDSRGRRPVILFGGLVNVVACLGYLAVDDLGPTVFGIRILHGCAQAMTFSAFFTVAGDIVPAQHRAQGLGVFGVAGMIPVAVAGWLGDALTKGGDYQSLFWTTAGFALAGLVVSLFVEESAPPGMGDHPKESKGIFFKTIADPALRPIWFVGLGFALSLVGYFIFLKTWVKTMGGLEVGAFFGVYTAVAIGLRVGFGWVPQRFGSMRVLLASLGAMIAGLMLLANAEDLSVLPWAGLLCGVGHGYAFPILSAETVARVRPAARGSAVTIFTALFDLGALAGAPILGWTAQHLGYSTMFGSAGVQLLVVGALFWLWERLRGREAESSPP